MKLEGAGADLVGSDIEYPEFDPWGFTKKSSPETIYWYRAAELKHGRVAMIAALGQIFSYYVRIGDPVFPGRQAFRRSSAGHQRAPISRCSDNRIYLCS